VWIMSILSYRNKLRRLVQVCNSRFNDRKTKQR
jgi:hypothetical protein